MGLDIDWLADFAALAESGTFSRAAALRHVTQPAFSRRIRALERWIGVPLFTRSARGAQLTPAGEAFHSDAIAILRSLAEARRATLDASGGNDKSVRFAATHTLSGTFFPGWLRLFQRHMPDIAIYLLSDSLDACETLMLGGNADFLLCHHHDAAPGRLDTPSYESLRIGEDRLVPMTATDRLGEPLWRLDGEGEIRLLAYAAESGLGRIFQAVAGNATRLRPVFTARLASTLLSSAGEQLGIAWLPQSLLDAEPNHGLVRAGPEDWDIALTIRLYRSAGAGNAQTEALWRLMEQAPAAG